ncbi:MAG: hypothetical protein HY237_13690 [Acidobacteria bacterium]|nr:hypothetical protein [Acidobacteriota bacterium]
MERPTGVTVLAILAFIGAGLSVLCALVMFVGGAALSALGGRGAMGLGMLAGMGAAVAGVFILFLAVVYAAVGYGLWTLQNWGRVVCIVLIAIGLVFAALGLLTALFHFRIGVLLWQLIVCAIDVWIITYLLKTHVKQAFGVA